MKIRGIHKIIGLFISTFIISFIAYFVLSVYVLPMTGLIISKDSAINTAMCNYQNATFTSNSEYLWVGTDSSNNIKPVWIVTVTGRYFDTITVSNQNGTKGEARFPLWIAGGTVTIDAITGKIINVNSYA